MADFQNFIGFVFEKSIVFHKAAIQNVYNVFFLKASSMCIFNIVKKQSSIGFIVDALFCRFAYLHNLYTVVELHTNFLLIYILKVGPFHKTPIKSGCLPNCINTRFVCNSTTVYKLSSYAKLPNNASTINPMPDCILMTFWNSLHCKYFPHYILFKHKAQLTFWKPTSIL